MQQSPGVLDVTGASIGNSSNTGNERSYHKDAPCIVLPHQSGYVSHIALDIGGSLIKLIYFSRDEDGDEFNGCQDASLGSASTRPTEGGKLHFVKFETSKLDQCMDFMESKGLHRSNGSGAKMRVKATGGGAYKYAKEFRERLGLILEREDEMACMVDGCNFLLKAVRHEAFMYENSKMTFVDLHQELYPYLLVNIGSGVSMVRVDGEGKYQRVSGTNIGGGTFWGLCRLLTGLANFDEILELTSHGDNSKVDMLVGDIYGGRDYTGIGLSANTIASSFGKVLHGNKSLDQYQPADIALSLCRMISYNIGQLAYLNAKRYNLSRIFFGGFFIRGHPYTMETISFAIRFWSKGEMAAHFLRHEGFLGAVGAFMKVQAMRPLHAVAEKDAGKVRARFVERFKMGAPLMGGEIHGPAMHNMHDKMTWVEKLLAVGRTASNEAKEEHQRALQHPLDFKRQPSGIADFQDIAPHSALYTANPSPLATSASPRIKFHMGVLHFSPYSEPFSLLEDSVHYDPNTIDINNDRGELEYWVGVLQNQIPDVVEKAFTSEGGTKEAQRRAFAFGRALDLHFGKLQEEPGAYGQLGLADLFELREECLREFGFADVYRHDKARENTAALEVLPDLLAEVDAMPPLRRLLALLQGVLAANIFDWGAKSCVDMYQNATILEMYREARTKLSARPWRVDHFESFAEVWFSHSELDDEGQGAVISPYKRVIIFVDNAGADVVLGMLPFARELLKMGAEVVLVANSLPAINDITAAELRSLVAKAAELDPTIRAARDAAVAAQAANNGRIPPYRGMRQRSMSPHIMLSTASTASPPRQSVQELPAARSAGGFAFGPAPVYKTGQQHFQLLGQDDDVMPRRHTASHPFKLEERRLPAWQPLHIQTSHSSQEQQPGEDVQGRQQLVRDERRNEVQDEEAQKQTKPFQSSPTADLQEAMAMMAGATLQEDEKLEANSLSGDQVEGGPAYVVAQDKEKCCEGIVRDDHDRETQDSSFNAGSHEPNGSGSSYGSFSDDWKHTPGRKLPHRQKGMFGESYPSPWKDPRLFIVASGHGSPCLDLRRVSADVADATVGADLVVIEGMGRAIHTNYNTKFKCDALKLAMIKNKHLAECLFQGNVYDCICRFDSTGY